jgi:hypothetical protein
MIFLSEENQICTIQIPQTYMSHLNKQLDKDGGGSTNKSANKGIKGGGDNVSITTSGTSKHTKATLTQQKSSAVASGKSKSTSRRSSSVTEGDSSAQSSTSSKAPVVGLQYLYELYLRGNAIESLTGIEAYGTVCGCRFHVNP